MILEIISASLIQGATIEAPVNFEVYFSSFASSLAVLNLSQYPQIDRPSLETLKNQLPLKTKNLALSEIETNGLHLGIASWQSSRQSFEHKGKSRSRSWQSYFSWEKSSNTWKFLGVLQPVNGQAQKKPVLKHR